MFARAVLLLPLLALSAPAQTEGPLFTIAQTGIGSNGFGTTWRGQDVQIADDAWLTRIVFQTGSATPYVDEIRLMTAVPSPVTLSSITTFTTTANEVTATLPLPYLLRGGMRYTVWFHQTGTPRGTYGCNLWLIDPTWGGYHTNVDPTVAPGPGEPGYYWAYQYGTNMQLIGFDNLSIGGTLVPGGAAQIQLQAPPLNLAILAFGFRAGDLPVPNFLGALRLDPAFLLPGWFFGVVDPAGSWITPLPIPNNPSLRGLVLRVQAAYDASFASSAMFSPMDTMLIQ